jgi:hypothetical protein
MRIALTTSLAVAVMIACRHVAVADDGGAGLRLVMNRN